MQVLHFREILLLVQRMKNRNAVKKETLSSRRMVLRHALDTGRRFPMLPVEKGECGLCAHFGETHNGQKDRLAQIRLKKQAPEKLVDDCGHPQLVSLRLKVTPISGCDGFEQAASA
jgi:hypothetical protein